MKHIPHLCLVLFLTLGLTFLPACAGNSKHKIVAVAESEETIANWQQAQSFQAEGRYELARQYYALALSTALTQSAVTQIERALAGVDLQIKTMR